MANQSSNESKTNVGGGFVGFLDLPKEATVGVDGQTIMLKADDFIGIRDIPPSHGQQQLLHLATSKSQMNAQISIGFFFRSGENLIRKYNPQSEEVSSDPVDELTAQNLLNQVKQASSPNTITTDIGSGSVMSHSLMSRILPYARVVSQQQQKQWIGQTGYISSTSILEKRNIPLGCKIIPGSFSDENDDKPYGTASEEKNDGHFVSYPPIPVTNDEEQRPSKTKMIQHLGYKRYLAQLTPSERTQLYVNSSDSSCLGSRILQDVLQKYYDCNYKELLADIQLAYILILNLQCFASLEHWRDLIAMLSLVDVEHGIRANAKLFKNLIKILPYQICTIENSFLEVSLAE